MATNKQVLSNHRQKRAEALERKNPFIKLSTLINQYHAIDLMSATQEEKNWAKDRLLQNINAMIKPMSSYMQHRIRDSLKNKREWEDLREKFL